MVARPARTAKKRPRSKFVSSHSLQIWMSPYHSFRLNLGGLGIPDLKVMGLALRLCWLWLQRCDGSKSWSKLPVATGNIYKAFFRASISCLVSNGEETLFWENPWLDRLCTVGRAPDLVAAVSVRRTVPEGLTNDAWIRDITGALSIPVIVQYLQLRARLIDV
jgi:hypothetical protein